MTMSKEQLFAVEKKLSSVVPASWKVVASENWYTTGGEDRAHLDCALCGATIGEYERMRRVTWKVLTPRPTLRYVSAIICRNSSACARRRLTPAD